MLTWIKVFMFLEYIIFLMIWQVDGWKIQFMSHDYMCANMADFRWDLLTWLVFEICSWGKCLTFWCMHHNVVLRIANTQIVGKWRGFSAMEYNAKHVLLVAVYFVRKCGICCNFMHEHAKNLNATYHVAGTCTCLPSVEQLYLILLSCFHLWV